MGNMGKVRFAIVGCGVISEMHFKGIEETEEAELVAVCDYDREVTDKVSKKYHVPGYYNLEDLLKEDDIDVVSICTPSSLHAEQTILAAKARKHVLVEKPMAIHLKEIDRMIEACEENNVQLATVFPRRMSPQVQYVRDVIQEGRLGKLSLCSAYAKIYRSQEYYDSAGWRGTWEFDGGGAMMNQGIHTVDLLQWLTGPVSSLYGKARTVLRNIEVEDTVTALLNFDSGAMGVIEITTTATLNQPQRIEIHGERGSIILKGDDITTFKIDGEDVELPQFEPFKVLPDGHEVQIRDMAKAIQEGRKPIVIGPDGRHSLEIILGTYESSGNQVEISFSKG